MNKILCGSIAAAALLLSVPVSASAKEADHIWLHKESGISVPLQIDGIKAPSLKPTTNDFDRVIHYGGGGETVSLYIFRATYPNAALWFERAETTLGLIWKTKGLVSASEVSPISIGGDGTANGLSHIYTANGGKTTTAVAVAQVGRWIIKVRSTSDSLDVSGQKARLERVYSAITSDGKPAAMFPLKIPAPCRADATRQLDELISSFVAPSEQTIMMASLMGAVHVQEVAGSDESLAANPEAYCRSPINTDQPPYATVYRRRDNPAAGWIALLADSGRSLTATPLLMVDDKNKDGATALVFANALDKIHAMVASKGIASPDVLVIPALQMLQSGGSGFAEISYEGKNIQINLPKDQIK